MDYVYEAKFELMDDGDAPYWFAEVPAFGGAVFDSAATLPDACRGIAETLQLIIAEYVDDGWDLPEPTFHEPPLSVVCVEVTPEVIEETKHLTISQAAEELDVTPGRVCQLIKAGILEAREFHGRRMVSIESVNRRKANRRGAGRPRRELANT